MAAVWPVPGPFFSGDKVSYFCTGQKHFQWIWLSSTWGRRGSRCLALRNLLSITSQDVPETKSLDSTARPHLRDRTESPKPVARRQTLESVVGTRATFLDPPNWAHWVADHWKGNKSVLSLMDPSYYSLTYIWLPTSPEDTTWHTT